MGFGSDSDEYNEEEGIDATVYPRNEMNGRTAVKDNPETGKNESEEDSDLTGQISPDTIFVEVLEVFNNALPSFIKDSIDPETQRKLLYDSLSDSVKEYIRQVQTASDRQVSHRWQNERARLNKEIDDLRAKVERAENGEQESKKSQLSAERQKRAMNERLHDLESQIATLQAEQEQFDLENKSLVNKLRAAAIHEEDNVSLREQVASLSEQVRKGQSPALSQDEIDEIETLRAKAAEVDKLREENKILLNDIAVAKSKIEMSDQMYNGQLNINSASKEEIRSKTEMIEKLGCEIEETKTALDTANSRIAALEEELTEANAKVNEIHEIEKQVLRFNDIKLRKEARIEELQKEKEALAEDLRIAENEIAVLKKTVERNLLEQSRSEKKLRDEIQTLKERDSNHGMISEGNPYMPEYNPEKQKTEPKAYPVPARKKSNPVKISAIDDSLDNTDWLVSTPPEKEISEQKNTSDDFGYVSPVKKNPPENDAQMLLF